MPTALATTLTPPTFSRPTWAEIDLNALRQNVCHLRACLRADTQVLAVIKANAYGHGVVAMARALLDLPVVQMLGVASVDEGVQLREAGITAPILLLSAILSDEASAVVEANLIPTVYTREVAASLNRAGQAAKRVVPAHFKIDTGMGRLGAWHCQAAASYRSLGEYSHLQITGIYTHFACADEAEDETTSAQLEAFEAALDECGVSPNDAPRVVIHAASSAPLLRYPQTHFNLVRPGLALYGVLPSTHVQPPAQGLRPVMSLQARVTHARTVERGTAVSYGATWRAPRPSRIAVVPVGYADGYQRCLSGRAQVLVRGVLCPVVGRVTMDQILVDCTDISPNVEVGEIVTLWGVDAQGNSLPVEEVASWAGTIPYELLCGVAHRVPRVYIN